MANLNATLSPDGKTLTGVGQMLMDVPAGGYANRSALFTFAPMPDHPEVTGWLQTVPPALGDSSVDAATLALGQSVTTLATVQSPTDGGAPFLISQIKCVQLDCAGNSVYDVNTPIVWFDIEAQSSDDSAPTAPYLCSVVVIGTASTATPCAPRPTGK
jgi:hypothetical protein